MKNLEKQAIGIVAQLFDLAEVPVDKRQEINDVAYDYVTEQLIIADVRKWQFLATTTPNLENKYYIVLDKYGNVEEDVLFGCSGFMGEPFSFFEGKKIRSKDIIAFC